MYAAVRLAPVKPGMMEEVGARIRDEFVPMMQAQGGLTNYFLVKSGDEKVITVSVFESEDHAIASNDMAENLGQAGSGRPAGGYRFRQKKARFSIALRIPESKREGTAKRSLFFC